VKRTEAEKRKRDEEDEQRNTSAKKAAVEDAKKAAEKAAAEEQKKPDTVATRVAANPTEALLAGASGSGFEMELGQAEEKSSTSPKVKVVAKDWWRGTQHAGGFRADGISEAEEARRGNWFCESHHCNGHENPKLCQKCLNCGSIRRQGIEGYRPEMRNTSGQHARYTDSGDNHTKMMGS